MYSIGVTGLVVAARNCRPDQEPSFGSYVNTRIEGAILDELRRMDFMSRTNRSKAKRLGSAISKLEQEQGGSVCQDSLCAEMQLTEGELAELQEDVREVRFVSLDELQGDSEEQSLTISFRMGLGSALDALERKKFCPCWRKEWLNCPRCRRKYWRCTTTKI